MRTLFFNNALLTNGWAKNVCISIDNGGTITNIQTNCRQSAAVSDGHIAVAGMPNVHSHSFQRAMAGLGEWRGNSQNDTFWSWREIMYKFLAKLRPDDLYAITMQLYAEMLEAGFTTVGEFHYLHNNPNGKPYDNMAETSVQIMQAADFTGIGLTLLPVLYTKGDFVKDTISPAQKAFYNDINSFMHLLEACNKQITNNRTVIGVAPHSLRAVGTDELSYLVNKHNSNPIHIHIAEQLREVRSCIKWSQKRPVEWLFANYNINDKWCLIHATHVQNHELNMLATSRATVGLCPITEANLGDGIFPAKKYHQLQGYWAIGSDSNVRVDVAEELRSLEYSQRLRDKKRNLIADINSANGKILYESALVGGARALQQKSGSIKCGNFCDVVALNHMHPALIGKYGDNWLNGWIFSGDKSCVQHVWVSGKQVVKNGKHIHYETIKKRFINSMEYLLDGL